MRIVCCRINKSVRTTVLKLWHKTLKLRLGSLNKYEHWWADTVALKKWNLSLKVQGELCGDHLYPKEYWETPTWPKWSIVVYLEAEISEGSTGPRKTKQSSRDCLTSLHKTRTSTTWVMSDPSPSSFLSITVLFGIDLKTSVVPLNRVREYSCVLDLFECSCVLDLLVECVNGTQPRVLESKSDSLGEGTHLSSGLSPSPISSETRDKVT